MSSKARDASPTRKQLSFEEDSLRVGCSTQHQWVLLYCGIALECDVPIMEALFWPTMAYVGPRSPYTCKAIFDRMEFMIRARIQQMCPNWLHRDKYVYESPTHHKFIGILSRAGKCIEIYAHSADIMPGIGLVKTWRQEHTISFVEKEYLTLYTAAKGRISIRPGQFNATIEALIQAVLDKTAARKEPLE